MLKSKKTLLVATLLAISLLLAACGSPSNSLQGKWKPQGDDVLFAQTAGVLGLNAAKMTVEFTADGKIITLVDGKPLLESMKTTALASGLATEQTLAALNLQEPEMTYATDGNKIVLSVTMAGETRKREGSFALEGDKLTITVDEQSSVFTKEK